MCVLKVLDLIFSILGSVAKNLAPLQNQKKPSQLGYLIDFITDKITHKGKNYSLKLRKYYFCTRTANFTELSIHFLFIKSSLLKSAFYQNFLLFFILFDISRFSFLEYIDCLFETYPTNDHHVFVL